MKKELNESAVALGKLSAKSRLGGLSKKQRAEKMKALWLKSLKARGIASVHLTKEKSTGGI